MQDGGVKANRDGALAPYLSPFGVWALAVGSSIGWGSLVVTGSSFLSSAGPVGSLLGLVLGVVVILAIARNYHYMMNCHPDSGGVYSYVKNVFGYDSAFLTSWFLILTYLAILWANASSLPLFATRFFGNMFQVGYLYTLFEHDVYAGEILLTMAAIAVIGLACAKGKRFTVALAAVLVVVLCLAITVSFVASMAGYAQSDFSIEPLFVPDSSALNQILQVAYMTPWAFIGFESISHSTEEFSFSTRRTFGIFVAAVATIAVLYGFVTLLSVTAYPPEYGSWLDYISDLGNLQGIRAIPAFYAVSCYLGGEGVAILAIALLALVVTSLIGTIVALSRLVRALALDGVLPAGLSRLNRGNVPQNAVYAVAGLSLVIPFLGRTALGWIVDVTTIGAVLVYGLLSAAVVKSARADGSKLEVGTGVVGLAAMAVMGAVTLVSPILDASSMAPESYFLFTVWSLLGFVFFRIVLRHDEGERFGKHAIVWIVLLALALFMSLTWMSQYEREQTDIVIAEIQRYYEDVSASEGVAIDGSDYVQSKIDQLHRADTQDMMVVLLLFGFSLGVMISNFAYVRKREEESAKLLGEMRSVTYTDPLTGVKSKHAYVEWEQRANGQIGAPSCAFAVVVCDVNGLKHINDTLGHKAGDAYIIAASRLICTIFTHSPVFRIGGDEFVVALEGDDYARRDELVDMLNVEVEKNLAEGGAVVSAGIACYRAGEDGSVQSVFERADSRMYERKVQLKQMGAITRD